MKHHLTRLLPTPEALRANRWLRWLGPALHHPRLWHASRRGIALGVALGVFFGFLVPIAQIPLSAAAAMVMRANMPTAVASTLVSNPLTYGPIYYAAWRTGNAILGKPVSPVLPAKTPEDVDEAAASAGASWLERSWRAVTGVGRPLLLGLAVFACAAGVGTWVLIHTIWSMVIRIKRWRRLRRSARRPAA